MRRSTPNTGMAEACVVTSRTSLEIALDALAAVHDLHGEEIAVLADAAHRLAVLQRDDRLVAVEEVFRGAADASPRARATPIREVGTSARRCRPRGGSRRTATNALAILHSRPASRPSARQRLQIREDFPDLVVSPRADRRHSVPGATPQVRNSPVGPAGCPDLREVRPGHRGRPSRDNRQRDRKPHAAESHPRCQRGLTPGLGWAPAGRP